MCRKFVNSCPDRDWNDKIHDKILSHILFHGIVYVDFHLNDLDTSIQNPVDDYKHPSVLKNNYFIPSFDFEDIPTKMIEKRMIIAFIDYL